MPELPEVETIARNLREGHKDTPSLVGRRIAKAEVSWHKTIEVPSTRTFKKRVVGQTIQDVGRRGKYITFQLSDDVMLVHLRMSGDLLVGEGDVPLGSHSRMALFMLQTTSSAVSSPQPLWNGIPSRSVKRTRLKSFARSHNVAMLFSGL